MQSSQTRINQVQKVHRRRRRAYPDKIHQTDNDDEPKILYYMFFISYHTFS